MSFKLEFKKELFRAQSLLFVRKVTQALQSPELFKLMSETYINDLKFQVRRGKSLATGSKLKPLSKGWIETRKRIIKANGRPPYVTAGKSNLSLSGDFLNSLKARNEKLNRGLSIRFFFDGYHEPYSLKAKKRTRVSTRIVENRQGQRVARKTKVKETLTLGKRIRNEDLYTYLTRERPFIGIRAPIQKTLRQQVIEQVRRITSQG
jgi:hypothetical protein